MMMLCLGLNESIDSVCVCEASQPSVADFFRIGILHNRQEVEGDSHSVILV